MGEDGVSEVVGQILMFGILSMVLILSLHSFNIAKEQAQDRVVAATADSVAQRVASLVVSTSLFAEGFREMEVQMESRLQLPLYLENRDYQIQAVGTPAGGATSIQVFIPSSGQTGTAPLFASGSADKVHVCHQDALPGGSVRIQVLPDANFLAAPDGVPNVDHDGDPATPAVALAECAAGTPEAELYVYLESAP